MSEKNPSLALFVNAEAEKVPEPSDDLKERAIASDERRLREESIRDSDNTFGREAYGYGE